MKDGPKMTTESKHFLRVVHYADDDDWGPICRGGQDGDFMTFFTNETTCPYCLELFEE